MQVACRRGGAKVLCKEQGEKGIRWGKGKKKPESKKAEVLRDLGALLG